MKKIISISIVLMLVAGAVFAQQNADGISINAWGRGAFTPLQIVTAPQVEGETGKDAAGDDLKAEVYTGAGVTWGGNKSRVDFRINGNSEFVGFQIHSNTEDFKVANGDNGAHIWAKPFGGDILKFTVGSFVDDTLRGKIGNLDDGFSNFVLGHIYEEDAIFNWFGGGSMNSTHGSSPASYMLSSVPMEGLFIGLLVNGSLWGESTPAANAYRYMQVGAGYEIAGIGHFRAQYVGGWAGTVDPTDKDVSKYFESSVPSMSEEIFNVVQGLDPTFAPGMSYEDFIKAGTVLASGPPTGKLARIEVAFALTAVEGLLIDLGAKIGLPLEIDGGRKYSNGFSLSLGANFTADALGIGFRADLSGLGAYDRAKDNDDSEKGGSMTIRLVPTYNLGFATAGLDIAFAVGFEGKDAKGDATEGDAWNQMGFGAFIEKGLGKGSFRAGLSYTLPPNSGKDLKANGSGVFQIPIILQYAFF